MCGGDRRAVRRAVPAGRASLVRSCDHAWGQGRARGLAVRLMAAMLRRVLAEDGVDSAAGGVVVPVEMLGEVADHVEAVAAFGHLAARPGVADDRAVR